MTVSFQRGWVKNIGTLLPLDSEIGRISNAAIRFEGGRIRWAGRADQMPSPADGDDIIDAGGRLVTPGLIDCHTHLLFGGLRPDEFFARLAGETYEEIGRKGRGIHRTVAATRDADDDTLLGSAKRRLDQFLRFGVTTVEVKSGYGLSTDQELRLLRLLKTIDHSVDVIPTFLGAHFVPKEFAGRRKEYVQMVCEEMLPRVAQEKLSTCCDVFCDEGAFTAAETRTIFTAAKKHGLSVKLHADQLKGCGGAELAAEFNALSADHLEQVSEAGIAALAKAGVVGVLLPGAVFFLGKRTYPPARRLIDGGVLVALPTDCNPGTSYTENLPLMMSLAAVEMKMSADEIWSAVTVHAARALGLSDRGTIAVGQKADLVIWDAEDPEEIPYHYGNATAWRVVTSAGAKRIQ